MGNPLWTVAELLNDAAVVACAQLYLHRRLGTQRHRAVRLALGGLLVLAVLTACRQLAVPDSVRIPLLAVCCVFFGLNVADGRPSQRILHAFIAFSLVALSDVVVIATLTFLPGVTFGMIFQQTPGRLMSMAASKVLLTALVIAFSRRREGLAGAGLHLAYVALVPLISISMLTVLIYYETMLDGHGSLGLLLIALGLFVMNTVLLALHDRLAARAADLLEKQRMLEQSEIRNRYLQETLAANDNLRGFRHDLKNHLQVLNGLLEMGKLERANDYLNEIGNFVNRNDFIVDSGVPLVDAVLGSKLAMAKKQGIDMTHAVDLEHGIPIDALDLGSILGNTLDNALEACQRIAGDGERHIDLTLAARGGAVELAVRNSAPENSAASLKSDKQGDGHGIGLSIVQKAVQKYGGTMEIAQAGGEFALRILLPAPQQQ